MLGEIRDGETARISIQTSLIGHLVLATVHTNDAVCSISRRFDMDVERFPLASTLRGVLAQHVVRKPCVKCSKPANLPAGILAQSSKAASEIRHVDWRPIGYAACNKGDHSGRNRVYEIVEFDAELHQLVAEDATTPKILAAARQRVMTSLRSC